jgi:hypothetical protein
MKQFDTNTYSGIKNVLELQELRAVMAMVS